MKKFNLAKYILPSVLSMVMVGTYTNIDGLFIGNRAGDDGLAAINMAWPIVAFITSVGTGLGIGASVAINGLRGKNEYDKAENTKFTALMLLLIAGVLSTAFCLLAYSPLLKITGAKGAVYDYASDYSVFVSLGALFQVAGAGLTVLLRNEGKTCLAMIYTAIGLAVHVALDFLVVEKFALYGVAASTVAAQLVVAALSLASYLACTRKSAKTSEDEKRVGKNPFNLPDVKSVLKNSVAPFGLNFAPSAVLLFTNYFAMKAGGASAVGAYAVMSYVLYTYDYVFQGVCDGVQPVLSFYEGANCAEGKRHTARTAIMTLCVLSAVFILLTPAAAEFLPKVFAVSASAESALRSGFIIYAFAYPLKAAIKFICAYFYSVGKVGVSNVVTYLDPLLFTPLSLALLSVNGVRGVWLALPISQVATLLAATVLIVFTKLDKKVGR